MRSRLSKLWLGLGYFTRLGKLNSLFRTMLGVPNYEYRPGRYDQDTRLIHPCTLDCGIRAADGLDNSVQVDNSVGPVANFPSRVF